MGLLDLPILNHCGSSQIAHVPMCATSAIHAGALSGLLAALSLVGPDLSSWQRGSRTDRHNRHPYSVTLRFGLCDIWGSLLEGMLICRSPQVGLARKGLVPLIKWHFGNCLF